MVSAVPLISVPLLLPVTAMPLSENTNSADAALSVLAAVLSDVLVSALSALTAGVPAVLAAVTLTIQNASAAATSASAANKIVRF